VPDSLDRELEQLLGYTEATQAESFVMAVMRGVRREQRTRKVVLWVCGLVGALFGLAGAVMLSGPISQLFTFKLDLPMTEMMQAVLFTAGAAAFYLWFMNDDFSLGG
jgi:ABC-type uncharacterized transport system permease subunit